MGACRAGGAVGAVAGGVAGGVAGFVAGAVAGGAAFWAKVLEATRATARMPAAVERRGYFFIGLAWRGDATRFGDLRRPDIAEEPQSSDDGPIRSNGVRRRERGGRRMGEFPSVAAPQGTSTYEKLPHCRRKCTCGAASTRRSANLFMRLCSHRTAVPHGPADGSLPRLSPSRRSGFRQSVPATIDSKSQRPRDVICVSYRSHFTTDPLVSLRSELRLSREVDEKVVRLFRLFGSCQCCTHGHWRYIGSVEVDLGG